jgi:hypothetical protein
MADCVSVMDFTLVGDEKRRLGERRISATGRFLLPSLKAAWNCVGGSGGHPSAIAQGRFSRKTREMAHSQLFRSMSKKQTRYTSSLKWPTLYNRVGIVKGHVEHSRSALLSIWR